MRDTVTRLHNEDTGAAEITIDEGPKHKREKSQDDVIQDI